MYFLMSKKPQLLMALKENKTKIGMRSFLDIQGNKSSI